MAIGVDYSSARPGGAVLQAAGIVAAGRYLGGAKYGITNGEIADLTAHGIKIWIVFEPGDQEQMAKGYEQGKADARAAQALLEQLDLPNDMVIYSAADFDAANVLDAVMEYQRGWAEVLGLARAGIYGGGNTLLRARQNNVASHFWQAAGWAGSSSVPVESGDGGRYRMPFIDIYQVYGNVIVPGTDTCLIFTDFYGQNTESDELSAKDKQDIQDLIVATSYPFRAYQLWEEGNDAHPINIGGLGVWYHVPNPGYLGILRADGLISPNDSDIQKITAQNFFDYAGSIFLLANATQGVA